MTTLDFEWAHDILKDFGLDVEARNCLAKNHQLIDIAAIVYLNKGFGSLDARTANRLAKENRLMEAVLVVEKERQLKEKVHQPPQSSSGASDGLEASKQSTVLEEAQGLLKNIGLDLEARNCLARNKQLLDISNVVKNGECFRELDKEVLNILAKENRLVTLSSALKKYGQYAVQIKTAINRLGQTNRLTDIQSAIDKAVRRAIRSESANLTKDMHARYSADARRRRAVDKEITRINKIPFISERQQLAYAAAVKALDGMGQAAEACPNEQSIDGDNKVLNGNSFALQGKCTRELLSSYHYLLTSAQLIRLGKKIRLTRKRIKALANTGSIYQREVGNTYLYASSEDSFKHHWQSQLEYTETQFSKLDLTRRGRTIKRLVDNALMEKKWLLDKDYAAILVDEVQKLHKNTMGNVTMKKWTNELGQAHDVAVGGFPPLPPFHQLLFAHELTLKRASSDMRKIEAPLSSAMVDLNPHQVDAALFAFKGPMSRGAILCDEVGLGRQSRLVLSSASCGLREDARSSLSSRRLSANSGKMS